MMMMSSDFARHTAVILATAFLEEEGDTGGRRGGFRRGGGARVAEAQLDRLQE